MKNCQNGNCRRCNPEHGGTDDCMGGEKMFDEKAIQRAKEIFDNNISKTMEGTVWTAIADPFYWISCPHCHKGIFMSSPKWIERLKQWGRNFKK